VSEVTVRQALTFIAVAAVIAACGGSTGPLGDGDAARGEELFTRNCVACHGAGAMGTANGPPLVHELYREEIFADDRIADATRNGAPQRNWSFGRMPGIGGLSNDDVADLVAYIRQVQDEAGLND